MPSVVVAGPSWPFRGGIARTTSALAAELHARGSLAALLVPRRQYPDWLYPGGSDVDASACPRLPFARACFGVLEPWTWPAASAAVRASPAAAVVLPYWTWAWAPFERFLLATARRPAVAVVHNPADHGAGWLARLAARRVLARCRGFVCHAEAVARLIRGRFPNRPVTVHPLPAGAPRPASRAAARAALGVPERAVAFLCFGLIRDYKGVDVALDAFASLPRESGAVLLLAGEPWGEVGAAVRARIARNDLLGRVVARLEWVPEGDAANWFAAADACVLPYRSATGSAVAAEAMGWGLPIVGSAVGGIAEVVEDCLTGFLAPPGDVGALRAGLERLLDGERRGQLARATRLAAARWSWETYAVALERLVGEALAAGPGP